MAVGGVGWLPLSYSLPLLVGTHGPQPALAGANGTWFIWVVASQSVAVAATFLHPPAPGALVAIAVGCWAVGVVLYLLIAALVAVALWPTRCGRPSSPISTSIFCVNLAPSGSA
jgi:tellurite resistance protein TehA-like permease